VDPAADPPPLRNLVAPEIEPGPLDLYPGTLTLSAYEKIEMKALPSTNSYAK
jgi:hypothetical protein